MNYVPIAERLESGEAIWLMNLDCGGPLVVKQRQNKYYVGHDEQTAANSKELANLRDELGENHVIVDVALDPETHAIVAGQIGVYLIPCAVSQPQTIVHS